MSLYLSAHFDVIPLTSAGRERLLAWLEQTATRLIRHRHVDPNVIDWRLRQPLEVQGKIYPAGARLYLGTLQMSVENG